MKYTVLFLVLLLVVAGPFFHWSCHKKVSARNKVVLVMFDLSESTRQPETRGAYSGCFRTILSRITHGDTLRAAWITDRSEQELTLAVDEPFPPLKPPIGNPLIDNESKERADSALAARLETIYHRVDSVLHDQRRVIQRTAVMSSLRLAGRILKGPPEHRRILVILSDMIEDSESYSFEKENLTPERIREIIAREERKAGLPDLEGVRTYVLGMRAPTAERFLRLENFWRDYLRACKAVVVDIGGPCLGFKE